MSGLEDTAYDYSLPWREREDALNALRNEGVQKMGDTKDWKRLSDRAVIVDVLDRLVDLLNHSDIGEQVEVSLWQSSNDPGWKWAYVTQEGVRNGA